MQVTLTEGNLISTTHHAEVEEKLATEANFRISK
jgi:hypothetical protein